MTRLEHLLTIAAEESAEVAQRISKALRFGLEEIQPDQDLTNAQRIKHELKDLFTVLEMIEEEAHVSFFDTYPDHKHKNEKTEKVEKFLYYSALCGTLQANAAEV